jgi:hypothetical protein
VRREKDSLGGLLNHVVSVPSRDGDESNSLGVVSDLLDETGGLLDDLLESSLGVLGGVHLVDGNNELPDTEGEGQLGDSRGEQTGPKERILTNRPGRFR